MHNTPVTAETIDHEACSTRYSVSLAGESLTEMTNLSSEGSESREDRQLTQLPGTEHSDFSQSRDHE